jgi:hypothetical protein
MEPEDLLFWVDTFHPGDGHDSGVLCRRHADAMVVPRGWTLDDRREPRPRLFRTTIDESGPIARPKRRRGRGSPSATGQGVEQLELADTGPDTAMPAESFDGVAANTAFDEAGGPATPWMPDFDDADDLDGLLQVRSPLLARAFRGTERAR